MSEAMETENYDELMEQLADFLGEKGYELNDDMETAELLQAVIAESLPKSAQAVSLPDRKTILKAVASRLSWPSLHWDWSSPDAHEAIADAVLAALSTQPAAGEVECA